MTAGDPTVFISYSWDDPTHKDWVRSLAERLVTNGIAVALDQWDVQPGDSLTAFMEAKLATCDYALIICTPNYAQKSTERKGGVGYEQQIISGSIAAGIQRRKFIPVVRNGEFAPGPDCAIPPHFLGIYAVDMRAGSQFESSFEILMRAIFGKPAHAAPTLGKKPDLSAGIIKPVRSLRLPSLEFDGWELRSGVASNEQHPSTFHIPSAEDRASVGAGNVVKLHFAIAAEIDENSDETEILHERMWVGVKGRIDPYLWGILDNIPSFQDEDDEFDLRYGSEVIFLPEHIIDIHPMLGDKK